MLFVVIFLVSRIIPRFVSEPLCWKVLQLYPWKRFGPLGQPPRPGAMRSLYQMYPYLHLYLGMVTQWEMNPLQFPKVPFLYLYGKDKRVMFHSEHFLQKLEQRSDCRCVAYEDAGHWVHSSHPERMANDMREFFHEIGANTKSDKQS